MSCRGMARPLPQDSNNFREFRKNSSSRTKSRESEAHPPAGPARRPHGERCPKPSPPVLTLKRDGLPIQDAKGGCVTVQAKTSTGLRTEHSKGPRVRPVLV